eukprot:PhM_4_TR16528/c1_g1_i1/m.40431
MTKRRELLQRMDVSGSNQFESTCVQCPDTFPALLRTMTSFTTALENAVALAQSAGRRPGLHLHNISPTLHSEVSSLTSRIRHLSASLGGDSGGSCCVSLSTIAQTPSHSNQAHPMLVTPTALTASGDTGVPSFTCTACGIALESGLECVRSAVVGLKETVSAALAISTRAVLDPVSAVSHLDGVVASLTVLLSAGLESSDVMSEGSPETILLCPLCQQSHPQNNNNNNNGDHASSTAAPPSGSPAVEALVHEFRALCREFEETLKANAVAATNSSPPIATTTTSNDPEARHMTAFGPVSLRGSSRLGGRPHSPTKQQRWTNVAAWLAAPGGVDTAQFPTHFVFCGEVPDSDEGDRCPCFYHRLKMCSRRLLCSSNSSAQFFPFERCAVWCQPRVGASARRRGSRVRYLLRPHSDDGNIGDAPSARGGRVLRRPDAHHVLLHRLHDRECERCDCERRGSSAGRRVRV